MKLNRIYSVQSNGFQQGRPTAIDRAILSKRNSQTQSIRNKAESFAVGDSYCVELLLLP